MKKKSSLFEFTRKFSWECRESKEYKKRLNFWEKEMRRLRQTEERREISPEEGDTIRTGLVMAKEWLASRDALTGLYNRRELDEQFQEAFSHQKALVR